MNTTEIKVWLLLSGHRQSQIATDLGVSRNLVWRTINGLDKNRRVIRWLLDHGCPENYVTLPKKRAA